MRIIALGALVALASGCFTRADEVSERELRTRAASTPPASVAARRDTSLMFIQWASDAGPADRSPGIRPAMAIDAEAAR